MKVLGVIPARGGSKSIPRKNLADVAGRPLLAYIVEAGLTARLVDRLIVSTEDEEIADAARSLGAEVPFRRPEALATDEVSLIPVVQHAMRAMDASGFRGDVIVSLQATSPFLTGEDVDRVVERLHDRSADSAVSVERIEHHHPFWVKRLEEDRLYPFNEASDDSFLQRQDLPPAYILDGGIFARRRRLLESWSGRDFCLGDDVRAVVLGGEKSLHLDDPIQLDMVRFLMEARQ
jgi:CMP-N,N'-diacetyllegionaminic acid synthase